VRPLPALLVLAAVLAGCGKTESTKSAEAHLTSEARTVCKRAKTQEAAPQLPVPAAKKLRALIYADARLPSVKKLLADVREILKARERYKHQPATSRVKPANWKLYWREREQIGFGEGRAELDALGLSICNGEPATEALLD
jgi:hypothetical protein